MSLAAVIVPSYTRRKTPSYAARGQAEAAAQLAEALDALGGEMEPAIEVKPKKRGRKAATTGVKRVRKSVVAVATKTDGGVNTAAVASGSEVVIEGTALDDVDGPNPKAVRKRRAAAAPAAADADPAADYAPKAKKPRAPAKEKKPRAPRASKDPSKPANPCAKAQPRSKMSPYDAALAGMCKKLGYDASQVNQRNDEYETRQANHFKLQKAERAMKQRMFLMGRSGRGAGQLWEIFEVAGSTGNVYTIQIKEDPKCNCMDCAIRRLTCKHILFVLLRVLALPLNSPLWYQESFNPVDLRFIFGNAPTTVIDQSINAPAIAVSAYGAVAHPNGVASGSSSAAAAKPVPKRMDDGEDCPICFEEMKEGKESKKEALVFDSGPGGCGKAMHSQCFNQWAIATRTLQGGLYCVWCRHGWEVKGAPGGEIKKSWVGYVNVAAAAGIDPERDMNIYRRAINGELGRNPEPEAAEVA